MSGYNCCSQDIEGFWLPSPELDAEPEARRAWQMKARNHPVRPGKAREHDAELGRKRDGLDGEKPVRPDWRAQKRIRSKAKKASHCCLLPIGSAAAL